MDIAAWLQSLGLERYVTAFRDNEIDWEVLPRLTSEDLREIGVAAIGHRRKLLDAIAALGVPAAIATVAAAISDVSAAAEAERRQLTVMFCDLVGSTPLSTRYDPEDLREIIGAYHRCVADTVARFAGFVAKYMGDGVLVYFGYPEAHEDDAERAVRAGLAVIEAVSHLAVSERLQVRLGIASGLVVVGDLIGMGSAQERGVVGETPNLAARLQALARPGTLVIADTTRRHIGGLFEIDDLGSQPLAGFTEQQRAWRVIRESGVVSRFEALRGETLTPFVGREEEIELLLRRWQRATAGEGQVVLLSGEAGIGKSRLVDAFRNRIGDGPHTRLRYFCSPYHQGSALHPFIVQLERAAGFARDDTVEEKHGKIRGLLAPGTRDEHEMELLSDLLSLPNSAASLDLSPQRKREKLFEALLYQFEVLARTGPILMVFEDAHWIDPTSRELLDLAFDRVSRLPVLLVVTFRPDFQHSSSSQPYVMTLTLNRFGGHDGAAMVEQLAGKADLSGEIVEEIIERADGVPLFIEELTKAVLESGGDKQVAAVLAASPSVALSIPATLHASLVARLDRLGPIAKEIGQIGAVIGREFGYELIEQVAQKPAAELQSSLDRLAEAGLLFRRGEPRSSSYQFKHALIRDAAYETLLRSRRRIVHSRVLETLKRDPDVPPEILAYHAEAAALIEAAVDYWQQAGERALTRPAYQEAVADFTNAVRLVGEMGNPQLWQKRELALQIQLGHALTAADAYGAQSTARAFSRAMELAEALGDTTALFSALFGVWAGRFIRGEPATGVATHFLELTERSADIGARLVALKAAALERFHSGKLAEALQVVGEILVGYDPALHRDSCVQYGHDTRVAALCYKSWALSQLGFVDQADHAGHAALSWAAEVNHPNTTGYAYFQGALVTDVLQRRIERAEGRALTAIKVCDELALPLWRDRSRLIRGWALAQSGRYKLSLTDLAAGLADLHTRQSILVVPMLGVAAEAQALVGDWDGSIATITLAFAKSEPRRDAVWMPDLHRIRAFVLLQGQRPERDQAEADLFRAVELARGQRAKLIELRAATALARLWDEQGRRAEARDLLAPIYGWFTEGFDTIDLKDAQRVLGRLS
jgi:class 3 adenylate cyclase/predicted ATPase